MTVRAILLAAVLAGCTAAAPAEPTPTPPPWPDGWSSSVCGAIDDLATANDHLAKALDAGRNYDFDGAATEAGKAQSDAAEATSFLGSAGNWSPGASVVSNLTASSTSLRKGANLFKLSAQHLDASTIAEAGRQVKAAGAARTKANAGLETLRETYGFSC